MPTRRPFLAVLTLLAAVGLLIASPASAMFMRPPQVPTDRLIENIAAYIEENPEDAEAHYLLGRVHYMAFVHRSTTLGSASEGTADELPRVSDNKIQYMRDDAPRIDEEQAVAHAQLAIASFNRAIELDEANALYHLGLAGLYEQAAPLAEQIDPNPEAAEGDDADRASESVRFLANAIAQNLAAYQLGRDEALAEDSVFLPFYPVAYEAGKAYARLLEENNLPPENDQILAQISDVIDAIDKLPMAITPIVFRVTGDAPTMLEDLLADESTPVLFDLDADGEPELRPWVNPDTAILVWDPNNTGQITSGQQLFGNMTFFMLFSNGYRALDSLDNNRDGQLSGEELTGLSLWHDANTNGISEPGEVTPIGQTHIQSIATQQTASHGIHPMNAAGLTLEDGSTRPTWDWIIPAVAQNTEATP